MRVTRVEKPLHYFQTKFQAKKINDQNDPYTANAFQSQEQEQQKDRLICCDKQNKKLVKLRREYLRKIEEKQEQHRDEIVRLKKKHEQQKQSLAIKYEKSLQQREQYIRMLEQMVNNGEQLIQTQKQKQKQVDESKYVYTQYTKNYVPFYQQISDRIDFKIQPRMIQKKKLSLDSKELYKQKRSIVQSHSTHQCIKSNQSSKHKLIPKSKPSDNNFSEPNLFQGLVSYKIQKSNHRGDNNKMRVLRPFFL